MTAVTLDNGAGLTLTALPLGGIVTALRVPDRAGRSGNVVMALPTPADYERPHPHVGTLVGRTANRLAHGRFTLDGAVHQVPPNDGPHALHGGPLGFGRRPWALEQRSATSLRLRLVSEDGDQGYPGRLEVEVDYTLTPAQEWRIDYRARSDRDTVCNLTHHAYFNLAGGGSILDHRLTIPASRYCPVDAGLIPLGIAPVEGTPFDFRSPTAIGARIRQAHPQLLHALGYDHNWVLDDPGALAARLEDPVSGRTMEVRTTEPGLQFYSGNFLDGRLVGEGGTAWRQGDGLCLETQHFPDAPNQPGFPLIVLRAGARYESTTTYRFGVV